MTRQFTKYEGLGNDFIVVDAPHPLAFSADDARRLCDRHFGIGGDGLLLVSPGQRPESRATMTVLNADGSRPEMCGNGLRCVALHLAQRDGVRDVDYAIDTDAGPRACQVRGVDSAAQDKAAEVCLEMGQAVLLEPIAAEHAGQRYEFHRVSTGNPHAIAFDAPLDEAHVDRFAPSVSASIAGGSNVEFVTELGPGAFRVVVWERGVGRTLACGTGAVAVAVAAVATGRAALEQPISLHLPGGELIVTVRTSALMTTLRGPARRVFSGQF
jgi:diaminopimelate epimerase